MTVYDCFDIPFPVYCGITAYNQPPVTIYDSYIPKKIPLYNPDTLSYAMYVASGKSVNNMIIHSESLQFILLTYDAPDT